LEICIDKNDKVAKFTNFLLDLSTESRMAFAELITNIARREKELGRMLPAVVFGDANYALFIEVPNIILFPKEKREEYILANLVQNGREECWSINIVLDENDDISDVEYGLFGQNDISEEKRVELQAYGKEIVERRTEQILAQKSKKKIYPNEPCICGSGKKYKRCCGRK
jgi:uncharacterized protein YchJ